MNPCIIRGSASEPEKDGSGFLFVGQACLTFYPYDDSSPLVLVAVPVSWFGESFIGGGRGGENSLLLCDGGDEPIDSVYEIHNIGHPYCILSLKGTLGISLMWTKDRGPSFKRIVQFQSNKGLLDNSGEHKL